MCAETGVSAASERDETEKILHFHVERKTERVHELHAKCRVNHPHIEAFGEVGLPAQEFIRENGRAHLRLLCPPGPPARYTEASVGAHPLPWEIKAPLRHERVVVDSGPKPQRKTELRRNIHVPFYSHDRKPAAGRKAETETFVHFQFFDIRGGFGCKAGRANQHHQKNEFHDTTPWFRKFVL